MVTARVGWAVALDRNGYPLTVVRTVDGGSLWHEAGPPGLNGEGLRAAFYSTRTAWVTWSTLSRPGRPERPVTYQTVDGGKSWRRMGTIGFRAIGVSAPDMVSARVGYVTAGLGAAAGSTGVAIFRTGDGGARWQEVELTTFRTRPARGALPLSCDKGDAVFSAASTGWVTGSCDGGRPGFWVSRDAGRTWRYQALPRPAGTGTVRDCQCEVTAPVFTSPEDGALWVRGEPAFTAAGYLTRDGGRTWAPIRLPGVDVPLQTPDFVNSRDGFVLGGVPTGQGRIAGGELFATTDGGATWAVRPSHPLSGQAILDFLSPVIGFAISPVGPSPSYLQKSTDGGMIWVKISARLTTSSPGSQNRD